jgi:hypothetical protein
MARNQQIFENPHDNPREILTQAIMLAHEWQSAQLQSKQVVTKRSLGPSKAPDLDLITCQICKDGLYLLKPIYEL